MPKIIDETGNRYGRLLVCRRAVTDDKNVSWLCRCDCGNETVVRGDHLREGASRSCRCLRNLPTGHAAFNALYKVYIRWAKKRNLVWNLSREQFRDLTQGSCSYCGSLPQQIYGKKSSNGRYIYNGIDRIDSSLGYVPNNVTSCCGQCNMAKRDMTVGEFIAWGRSFYKHSCK